MNNNRLITHKIFEEVVIEGLGKLEDIFQRRVHQGNVLFKCFVPQGFYQ